MATDKNKTGNVGSYGSHTRTRSNGLEALESRLLFSAAALVPNVPEPVNDAATAIEASLVPDGPGDNGLGITEDGIGWIALPPTSSHATTEHINADDPEGSNPTPHPMPVPELSEQGGSDISRLLARGQAPQFKPCARGDTLNEIQRRDAAPVPTAESWATWIPLLGDGFRNCWSRG